MQNSTKVTAHQLPEIGFVRIRQILGDPKADPPILPIIPVSKSSWWQGIRDGKYPRGTKLGPRTTAWSSESLRALIKKLNKGALPGSGST